MELALIGLIGYAIIVAFIGLSIKSVLKANGYESEGYWTRNMDMINIWKLAKREEPGNRKVWFYGLAIGGTLSILVLLALTIGILFSLPR